MVGDVVFSHQSSTLPDTAITDAVLGKITFEAFSGTINIPVPLSIRERGEEVRNFTCIGCGHTLEVAWLVVTWEDGILYGSLRVLRNKYALCPAPLPPPPSFLFWGAYVTLFLDLNAGRSGDPVPLPPSFVFCFLCFPSRPRVFVTRQIAGPPTYREIKNARDLEAMRAHTHST